MINANMKTYNYFALGAEDEYGQPQLSQEPIGTIKLAIETTSQSVQDNILHINATYIGFTHAFVDDSFVIDYEGKKLKVQYVNPKGRFKQVYLVDYVN